MSSKRKRQIDKITRAEISVIARRNSQNSPWRKTPISRRSALCHEYFTMLAERGDTRRVPRPELD